jgi:transposase
LHHGDVLDAGHELRAAERAGEAEQQERAVAPAARARITGGEQLAQLRQAQSRGLAHRPAMREQRALDGAVRRVPGQIVEPVQLADEALSALDAQFAALYSRNGRPSIPPEQLLRALLLQAFYTIRSERQLMEQLNYNLLFRWFVGLSVDDPVWVPTVFSKNRDRLLAGDIAAAFMDAVLNLPQVKALLSDEHFSVDGTLIQAWASMKSFRRKDGNDEPPALGRNGERNFHKEKRSNETHASTTDPDARLARKSDGEGAKLAFTGHLLMENRNGLVVDARLTHATGTAEPAAVLQMLQALPGTGHKRSARTRATTPPPSSPTAAPPASRRMWRRTSTRIAARTSTGGRRAMAAIASVRPFASGSRRRTAGSSRWVAWRKPSCVG